MSNPRGVIDFRVLHTRISNRPWSMKTNQARILLASSFNAHWWQKAACAQSSRGAPTAAISSSIWRTEHRKARAFL